MLLVFHKVAIDLFHTIRADAVCEIRSRVVSDENFDLVPVALVVPNPFAG